MPANWRGDRSAELEGKCAREEADLAMSDDATLEEIEATLDRLRKLQNRVERQELEPDDWALLRAMIEEEL